MARATTIAVVEDHPLMLDGIVATLGREPDFNIVASGSSAHDAVRIAADLQPDIMVLDVNMPGGGLNAARSIAASDPHVRIVFLTMMQDPGVARAAIAAGARAFILKGVSGPDLVNAIKMVSDGSTYISAEFATRLLSGLHPAPCATALKADLTALEEKILQRVALGLTNKEVARKLGLTERTIKYHMTHVLQKLKAKNRVEAIMAFKESRVRAN